jgi:glycosyltransferase involved in cell wall biosynthesis
LVRPSRPDLVASAISQLASDVGLRERMGRAARERVSEEFDIRREAARLRDLFAEYTTGDPT